LVELRKTNARAAERKSPGDSIERQPEGLRFLLLLAFSLADQQKMIYNDRIVSEMRFFIPHRRKMTMATIIVLAILSLLIAVFGFFGGFSQPNPTRRLRAAGSCVFG